MPSYPRLIPLSGHQQRGSGDILSVTLTAPQVKPRPASFRQRSPLWSPTFCLGWLEEIQGVKPFPRPIYAKTPGRPLMKRIFIMILRPGSFSRQS